MNIKELASQVWGDDSGKPWSDSALHHLEKFAKLVAASEREACAELIEQVCHDDMTRAEEAAAIRARGDKHD